MAKYRTKVEVRTNGKVFKPGAILPDDISKLDLNFLKAKKFVEVVDVADAVSEADAEEDIDDEEFGDGFDEMTPGSFKTAEEIRKIRTKKDVAEYAASIGLDLGEDYDQKSLAELYDEVINYQEEAEAATEEDGE